MNEAGDTLRPVAPVREERDPSRRLWLLLTLLMLGSFCAFAVYPGLFFLLGVNHYGPWFLDTFALLASNDAVTRGLDPYAPNPLDYFHRPHVYSHWWLHLRDLGLTRADVTWLGLGIVGTFLAVALARLRPRTAGQLLWYAAVLGSAPVLLGVDRANNDLVIFILLAPLVPCLLSARPGVRWVAPFLVAAAAMLKYYPAAAGLVLLAAAERKELRLRLGVALGLLLLVGLSLVPDLSGFGPLAPKPAGLLSFGATAFFNALDWTGFMPKLLCAVTGLTVAVVSWRRRWLGAWEPAAAQQSDWLHFTLGAVLLTGCFFTSLNFGYRWIFALWLAPLLWTLPSDETASRAVRLLARWLRWLLVIVLWWDPVCCFILNRFIGLLSAAALAAWAKGCFLAEQPFDWALFLGLVVFLTHFTQGRLRVLAGR
jgi:hypothetical protein